MVRPPGLGLRENIPVSPRWRGLGALGFVVVIVAAGACEEQLSIYAFVRNQTGQPIDVSHVADGEEQLVASLDEPLGGSHDQDLFHRGELFPTGCTTGDLVARARDGTEIARLTEALCVNEGWLIERDGTSRKLP